MIEEEDDSDGMVAVFNNNDCMGYSKSNIDSRIDKIPYQEK